MAPLGRSAQMLMSKSRANYKTVGCVIINNGSMGRCFSDRPAQLHSIFFKYLYFFRKRFTYLAVSSLNCGTHGLCCISLDLSSWHRDSLVVARELQSM